MSKPVPEWFALSEHATRPVMQRVADAVSANTMATQVRWSGQMAHWFILDTLFLANQANREGMHANALALTRQCVEAMSVLELGMCSHPEAEATLIKWNDDKLTPGKLRAWLQDNVWPSYGPGLWAEPWSDFMREFAAAVQPYAHYGRSLAQWQVKLLFMDANAESGGHGYIEMRPRAYDPQKATRITLFHVIITYALGRIWLAANKSDPEFGEQIARLGEALGKSRYLDGHGTKWSPQFWAAVWGKDGDTVLE